MPVSEPVAAARLREPVDDGLLTREDYREPGQWGDRWLDDRGGPIELRHRDCGEPVQVEMRCASGHQVATEDVDAVRRRP